MQISTEKKGSILVITLEGENLDARESSLFKQQVMDLYTKEQMYSVILDLENLNFIDSTGLGAFLSLLRSLNALHGDLKLACLTHSIQSVFELVGMHKIFSIYSSVEEALQAFNSKITNSY